MGMGDCFTNIFVYFVRYGVLDWAPTYLSEEKHFDLSASGWAYFLYEWAGIPARYSVVIYLTNYLKVAVVQQASSLC